MSAMHAQTVTTEIVGKGRDIGPAEMDAAHRAPALRIIPFLCLAFLAAYIDRVNVGFAKLHMLDDLHMGDTAFVASIQNIGLLTMIPHFAAVISMITIGRRSDRFDERRWHIVVTITIGSIALGLSECSSFGLLGLIELIVLANAALLGALPPLCSLPASFLRGPAAAAGLAIACSFANISGFFATSVIGFAVRRF